MGWAGLLPHTFHLEEVSTLHTFSLHYIHIEYIEDNAWIKCGDVSWIKYPSYFCFLFVLFFFSFLILFSIFFKKNSAFNKTYWHWILGFDSLIGTIIILGLFLWITKWVDLRVSRINLLWKSFDLVSFELYYKDELPCVIPIFLVWLAHVFLVLKCLAWFFYFAS